MTKDDGKVNYLVFERVEPDQPFHGGYDPGLKPITTRGGVVSLLGYTCIGAVRAKDESGAVQAVIRATRRVGAYAVIEASFLDFTKDQDNEVDADVPELNP